MAINPDISDLFWLRGEPAGAPMARGAQAGATIASSFLRARELNLRRQELQQNAMRLAISAQNAQAQQFNAQTRLINQLVVNKLRQDKAQALENDNLAVATWAEQTGGDPERILKTPPPMVRTPEIRAAITDAYNRAANSGYALAQKERQTGIAKLATDLLKETGVDTGIYDASGNFTGRYNEALLTSEYAKLRASPTVPAGLVPERMTVKDGDATITYATPEAADGTSTVTQKDLAAYKAAVAAGDAEGIAALGHKLGFDDLDPLDRAQMNAELRAVSESLKAMRDPAWAATQTELIVNKYRKKRATPPATGQAPAGPGKPTLRYVPGQGLVPK